MKDIGESRKNGKEKKRKNKKMKEIGESRKKGRRKKKGGR